MGDGVSDQDRVTNQVGLKAYLKVFGPNGLGFWYVVGKYIQGHMCLSTTTISGKYGWVMGIEGESYSYSRLRRADSCQNCYFPDRKAV